MIKIDGQEVLYLKDSLVIEEAIEERTTCSFTVIDEYGEYEFRKGQNIEIYDDQTLIFSGVIDIPQSERVNRPDLLMLHDITAVDWHYLADKRIIAKAYENEHVGRIVRDIVSEKLEVEGVLIDRIAHDGFLAPYQPTFDFESTVLDGPVIEQAVFNYVRVSEALDSLAEKVNYWWKIDQHKRLFFVAKSVYHAPFPITGAICEKGSIKVTIANSHYRNRQYIKGAKDITDPQIEQSRGNGETRSFPVGFPIAKVPTIEVSRNGGPFETQRMGIRGLETGFDWYWSKGSEIVNQDESQTQLGTNDIVRITYQGEFDIVAISELDAEILLQGEIDGTSGIVEDVADEPQTTGRAAAFESANAKLARYGKIGRTLTFRTWKKGLEVGMLIDVQLAHHRAEGEFLIESITINKRQGMFWYTVRAVQGHSNISWTKYFQELSTRGLAIRENIQEDQILVTVAQFEKIWQETEYPNIFKLVYASDTLFPSDNLYPSFDPDDRVKYLSWYNGAQEVGRKPITKQVTEDGQIDTTTFLSPLDANGQITHLGWWGGIGSNDNVGSGVLVDRQPYSKNKTQLEAIQIEKRDIRDFEVDTGNLLISSRFMTNLSNRIDEVFARSV